MIDTQSTAWVYYNVGIPRNDLFIEKYVFLYIKILISIFYV